MRSDDLDRLIGAVYEAVADPAGWQPALAELRDAFGGASVLFWLRCPTAVAPGQAVSTEMDLSAEGAYQAHFWARDPWRPLVPDRPGVVHPLGDRIGETRLDHTEFYEEWLRPQGLRFGLAGCVATAAEEGRNATFAAMRSRQRGPFDADELELAERLLPHLRRALELREVFRRTERERQVGLAALECLPHAALLVDARSRLLAKNGLADGLLRQQDGLRCERGELRAAYPGDTRRLQALVHRAAATTVGQGAAGGGPLQLRKKSGDRLTVLVAPLPRAAARGEAAAAVFTQGIEPFAPLRPRALARLYGLTPTEARVAARLVEGATPREIATAMEIELTTVRSHLAAVFRKTGTRRQAELVRLLLRGVGAIPLESDPS